MLAIARSELIQIFRNRLILPVTAIALMQVVAILTVFAMPSHRCSPDVDLGVAP